MPSSRRYSESEIGALIQRATELHAAAGSRESELSMEEVERIATDLGVPAQFVRAAAVEMATGREVVHTNSLSGAPFRLRVAELIDGEIDDDSWADIVMELRRSVSASGKTEEIGSMREWKAVFEDMGTTLAGTQVIVRSKGEQSTFELERFYGGVAGFAYVMAAIVGFTVTGITLDGSGLPPWVIFPLAASGGVGGMAAVRAGISLWEQNQRKKMQRLMGRLRGLVGRSPSVDGAVQSESTTSIAGSETIPHEINEPAIQIPDDRLDDGLEEASLDTRQSEHRSRDHS